MKEIGFRDIPNLTLSGLNSVHALGFPEMKSNRQREWEYYAIKLHGLDLAATSEDLQTLKNLVNKLGR